MARLDRRRASDKSNQDLRTHTDIEVFEEVCTIDPGKIPAGIVAVCSANVAFLARYDPGAIGDYSAEDGAV